MGVVVVRGGPKGLEQAIEVGPHRLVGDEPVPDGGHDAGPSPYDYLLTALGTCKSMTMRLYADHKKWPLEGSVVRCSQRRIHARDCEDCETEGDAFVHDISCEIELAGPLTPEQRERLVEIAERCPVHRTLTSEIRIVTALRG